MKNKNLILIAGAAAVAAYFLMRRKGAGADMLPGMMAPSAGPGTVDKEQTDAVIDADKAKISVSDAIDAVSAVSEKIKDLKVVIKKGGEQTTVRTGKKQKSGAGAKRVKPKRRIKGSKKKKAAAQSIAKQALSPIAKAFEPSQGLKNVGKQFANLFPSF